MVPFCVKHVCLPQSMLEESVKVGTPPMATFIDLALGRPFIRPFT